ncbi:hypothetical protein BH09ACT3_BH09ACT3_14970 [soil metagenome]
MTAQPRWRALAPALLALLFLSACSSQVGSDGTAKIDSSKADVSAPTTATVLMTDPVENAFTVEVPEGWSSVAYSAGQFDAHREIVNAVSPDGGTVLFLGDQKIPNYWNPATANETTRQFAETLDFMELQPYTPAEDYFTLYADTKFASLPDYEFIGFESKPELVSSIQQQFVNAGLAAPVTNAVEVRFDYSVESVRMHGVLIGITIDSGPFWQADVNGLSTDRDPDDYLPMLVAMSNSKKSNPEFMARSNANHEATMEQMRQFSAQMTAQHNANMAQIAASAAAHQNRMQAIWASNDAQIQSYNDRMASGDNIQRNFLNYINEEETVQNSSGQTYQVATGYQNYYVNKNDNSYVGGDINFGDTQLRQLGLNPDDYYETTFKDFSG